jgi:hypothetical protein
MRVDTVRIDSLFLLINIKNFFNLISQNYFNVSSVVVQFNTITKQKWD